MANCSGLVRKTDLEKMKRQADFIAEVGTGETEQGLPVEYPVNPDTGRVTPAIPQMVQRWDAAATAAIGEYKLKNRGDYTPAPVTLEDSFEYVRFAGDGKDYFAVTPPYTTDPTAFPNPALDTNLIAQSYVTRGAVEKLAAESLKFSTVADLKSRTMTRGSIATLRAGDLVSTLAYRFNSAAEIGYGGGTYRIYTTTEFPTPNEVSDFLITGTNLVAVLLGREKAIWLEQYGAYNDGTQSTGITTAFDDADIYKSSIKFGVGTFDTPTQIQYHGYGIAGEGGVDVSFLGSSTYVGYIINKVKSGDHNPIKNFTLFGSGETGGQFGIGHDGNSNGWFNTVLDHIKFQSLQTCAEVQLSLSPTFRKIEMRNCGNGFYFTGPRIKNDPNWVWNASSNPPGKTAWYNNNPVFDGIVQTQCSGTAIDFVGTNLDVRDPTLQMSNRGVTITGGNCPSTANTISGTLYSEQNVVSVVEVRQDAMLTIAAGSTILCAIGGPTPSAVDKAIIADDGAVIYEIGDMAFLDIPLTARRNVTNNSKIISLGEYNESVLNIVDATSRYYSISTFVEGYNYPNEDEFINPVAGAPNSLNRGIRMADGAWEIYVTTPEGKKTSFTLYGELAGSVWTVKPYGGFSVISVTGGQFTVNLQGSSNLTFNLNTGTGAISVTSTDSTVGTLKIASRRILERQRQPES